MKRGKDDEKIVGPMFPRLHVNDTEKGGPKAPPRNKMALYEQLSIPSQRFSRPGMTPLNHNNNANFVPPASSSSQGNEHEMGTICPVQVPPSRHPAEKLPSNYLVPNAPSAHLRQKKKSDEDDLRVPIFVHSKGGQDCGKFYNNVNREKLSPSCPAHSNYAIKHQIAVDEDPKKIGTIGKNVKQNTNNTKGVVGSRKVDEAVSYLQSKTEARDPIKIADTSFSFELRDDPSYNYGRLQKIDSIEPEQRTDTQRGCRRRHLLSIQSTDRNHEDSSMSTRNFAPEERNLVTDTESREDRRCQSLQTNNGDQEDDASETSMVDSVSGVDISPDDVVGIMGQKHFWKARRAIVNQQRVFAVQVFELHRLMKVQRLIAKSPHLLLEDNAYLGRPIKVSSVKKLPLEYIGKGSSNVSEHKSEKPNNKMEFSAENTVGKASQSSVQNGGQPINYGTFAGNTSLTPTANDPNMGPWGFNQPQGHQWLVPVMSPSEGLVYKPYLGPGFTSPVCGGCGPPGSTPVISNFLPPAYGVPAPHHQYQVMGVPTFVPSIGPHGYFPPYGMQVMNPAMSGNAVEQISQFNTQGLQRQLSGGGANFGVKHQNSSDLRGQKSGADGHTLKLNVRKDSELQGSTASSPTERAGEGLDNTRDRRNPLPLFPTSPVVEVPSGSPRHHEGDQTARVIRVVPHNGRSATESAAARIFHSIQEERKQYDSV